MAAESQGPKHVPTSTPSPDTAPRAVSPATPAKYLKVAETPHDTAATSPDLLALIRLIQSRRRNERHAEQGRARTDRSATVTPRTPPNKQAERGHAGHARLPTSQRLGGTPIRLSILDRSIDTITSGEIPVFFSEEELPEVSLSPSQGHPHQVIFELQFLGGLLVIYRAGTPVSLNGKGLIRGIRYPMRPTVMNTERGGDILTFFGSRLKVWIRQQRDPQGKGNILYTLHVSKG